MIFLEDKFRAKLVGICIVAVTLLLFVSIDKAQGSGGVSITPQLPAKPKLVKGKVIPSKGLPKRVKKVIRAANRIEHKPYLWGGGHGSFRSPGYDCSGAVSYALKGGNFLQSPLTSGGLMSWRKPGRGRWITVYSNPGHVFLVVAGFRFDTSQTPGDGPGWSRKMVSRAGYTARKPGKGF